MGPPKGTAIYFQSLRSWVNRELVLSHILCNDTRYVASPQAGIRRLTHRRRPRVRCLSVGDSCAALLQSAGFGPLLEAHRAVLISLRGMGRRLFPRGSLWPAHTAFPKSARSDH